MTDCHNIHALLHILFRRSLPDSLSKGRVNFICVVVATCSYSTVLRVCCQHAHIPHREHILFVLENCFFGLSACFLENIDKRRVIELLTQRCCIQGDFLTVLCQDLSLFSVDERLNE